MNTDQLRERFPDEETCRHFFESTLWKHGRRCPHCDCEKTYHLCGETSRPGLYECGRCKSQFTVTTKTPMHSTKLKLWKWLLAMYYMVHSSKGVSSVFMAKWVGVTQKTAWKMCHAIRHMMEPTTEHTQPLGGVVELDEKYFGGKPRHKVGVRFKCGKGSSKQCVFVAVQRKGPVRSALVNSDKTAVLKPLVKEFVQSDAHLMTDQNHSYRKIGQAYADHSWVNHSMEEFSRNGVHNNTAESFNSLLERAKQGVFHYMSTEHLSKYLNEIGFRWDHRIPVKKKTKKGATKIKMVPWPVIHMLGSLVSRAIGKQNRRTENGGIVCYSY